MTYDHDTLDRVTHVWYPDNTHVDYNYLCCGLLSSVVDRAGRATSYDYDNLKRLIYVQDAANHTLHLDYDKDDNLVHLRDANNHDTYWGYDTDNFVYQKTYHDGTGETYRYSLFLDALDSTTDANGHTTRYTYDADLNPTGITYNTNLPTYPYPFSTYPTSWNVSYHYNTLNQTDTMTDDVGTTTYGYDLLGRPTTIDGPWDNDTLTYHYDNLGRVDWRQINGTNETDYHHDSLGRLDSVTSPAGTFNFSYVGNTGRIQERVLPNGSHRTYSYDARERLTAVQNLHSDGSLISRYAYGYDDTTHKGLCTWMEKQVGTNPLQHINFGYDTINQLANELSTETPTPQINNSYTYDAMGNRTSSTWPGAQNSYTPNALNQYTSIATTDGNGTSTLNLNYDYNGNLTSYGNVTYGYDDANRLNQIINTDPQTGVYTHKSEFVYDGYGRKCIAREYGWDNQNNVWMPQSELHYVYGGRNVLQERDGNNNILATYTRTGNIGKLLARSVVNGDGTTSHYYYHYDGRSNVTQLTDSTQTVVANYTYDAFGNGTATGPQSGQPYRFSTKEYHAYSGLYDFSLRFYSPGLGRWINRDPICEHGGLNVYNFVHNNPLTHVDGYGLEEDDENDEEGEEPWGVGPILAKGTAGVITGAGDAITNMEDDMGAAIDHLVPPDDPSAGDPIEASATDPVGHRGKPIRIAPGTNSPTTINGRPFSGHALDRMQERGIPPSVVENAIQHGEPCPSSRPDTNGFNDKDNHVKVFIDPATGRVVTVEG
ncbi:MAG: DUF4258 domain-containing protein [Abitibacteriaceae bacterium]|nr:DUF4258 domain-containing protein [Abditibacteriaceae bacterium]